MGWNVATPNILLPVTPILRVKPIVTISDVARNLPVNLPDAGTELSPRYAFYPYLQITARTHIEPGLMAWQALP